MLLRLSTTGHNHRKKQPPEVNDWGDVEGWGNENHQKKSHQYICLLMKSAHKDTQHPFTFMCTTERKLQKKDTPSTE